MKRILLSGLTALTLFSIVGCASDRPVSTTTTTEETTVRQAPAATTTTTQTQRAY